MARAASRIGFLVIALAVCAGSAMAADRMTVPGTAISMEPPDGFVPAQSFAGFQNMKTGASIAITEFPNEAYDQLAAVFSNVAAANAAFGAQQITLTEGEALPMATGGVLFVVHGTQQVGAATVEKWLALAGRSPTVLFAVNLPEGVGPDAATIRASLASLEFGEPLSIEQQIAVLPYAMKATEPFKITAAVGGSAVAMATIEGPDPTGLLPLVIVGWQVPGQSAESAAAVAEPLLRSTVGLTEAVVETTLPVSFAGEVGVKLGGSFDRDGTAMTFVQYVAVVDGQSVRLLATMKSDEAETLLPVVDQIARTVTRR